MPLDTGTRLGPYELTALIGEGGLGEVYKAADTRLNRTVAIKILPPHWSDDPAMKERFDREARTVASLSHPNICTLHDIGHEVPSTPSARGESRGRPEPAAVPGGAAQSPSTGSAPVDSAPVGSASGSAPAQAKGNAQPADAGTEQAIDFLVMEYLEGQTLAKRLERGALPLDESLKIAIAIADALDMAHGAGIVHRDLKPSNVMLTPGGPKLLDFGLAALGAPTAPGSGGASKGSGGAGTLERSDRAKAGSPQPPDRAQAEAAPSPRPARAEATGHQTIVGTLQYMAPERVDGGEPDARSDLFSLGCVLYEMVTGTRAFEGRNRALLIAAIATLELDPLSKTQPASSPALDHVAARCLAKDPDDRWQTAHDLALQLRWIVEGGVSSARPVAARAPLARTAWLAAAALVVAAVSAVPAVRYFQGTTALEPLQLRVPVAGLSSADIALSPDGETIALVARPNTQEPAALMIRPVGDTTFRKLGGTDEASLPFWSPDSRAVGFVAGGRLKRVDAAGGAPKDLGEAPGFAGGAWNADGVIVFGSARGLFRVSAEGGKPEAITTVEKNETGHYWPSFLPDGRRFTYLAWSAEPAIRAVFVGTLGSSEKTKLMAAESNAAYAAPGYLVFHREATLFAQPFDGQALALSGTPIHLADQLAFTDANGRGHFDVSQNGVLLYMQAGAGAGAASRAQIANPQTVFGWRDRSGKNLGMAGEQGPYGDIDLSPDGKFIAITRAQDGGTGDIWVIDWERAGVPTRLTLDPADDVNPVWSPTGDRIAFTSYRKGNADIYVKNANGVGAETAILESPANEVVEDWSKDGKYIAYKLGQEGFDDDLYVLPLTGDDKKPIPVVTGPFRKDEPQFSYDGRWLAYTSNESGGTFEVFVMSFPALDQKLRVTAIGGGGQPRWRKDGRELFYKAPDGSVMAVDIRPGPRIEAGVPRKLFGAPGMASSNHPARHQWNVTPDGQRFLLRYPNGSGATAQAGQGGVIAVTFTAAANPQGGGAAAAAPSAQATVQSGLTVVRGWTARKEFAVGSSQ